MFRIGRAQNTVLTQVTFSFLRFTRQDVTEVRLFVLDLPRTRHLESLLRCALRLHFQLHVNPPKSR